MGGPPSPFLRRTGRCGPRPLPLLAEPPRGPGQEDNTDADTDANANADRSPEAEEGDFDSDFDSASGDLLTSLTSLTSLRAAEQELADLKTALKAAVDAEDYEEAFDYQVRLPGLTEEVETLRVEQAAIVAKENERQAAIAAEQMMKVMEKGEKLLQACDAEGVPLSHADEAEADADEVWDGAIARALGPLGYALDSTIAIVQQSVTLASANGLKKIVIGPASAHHIRNSVRENRDQEVFEPTLTISEVDQRLGRDWVEETRMSRRKITCDGLGGSLCSVQDGMPDQGYIVYLPGHCVIPVAYDMKESHYKTIHRATDQPPLGARSDQRSNTMMPEKESALHGEEILRSTCTEEESMSYSAAFDPVTLHPYEDIAQVMVDPWSQLYLRWFLAENGYRTSLVQSNGMGNDETVWSDQWLVVEWDTVRPRARESIDSTMKVFGRCGSFREVAQLASEITSEGVLEYTGLEKFEAKKKQKSEAMSALEKAIDEVINPWDDWDDDEW
eukprot:CAMPEP_0182553458 /NCGR_PEP_ID=MMETSP1323-20130603/49492_1 /TAXON_ID=236787 /ORGANISM="Florenciella parvula, Strain RCC1693" /LENGTH=502 /DNA_ID=CAMNT_0024765171 /DNA_START=98 /DNA_END=1606 /DNA_ORIENTATION=+